jgi:alanine racemase
LKTHRARLWIDLGAIAANWRRVRAVVPRAKVAAVLKRDAYGLGLEPVARVLAAEGCCAFFVADAAEAVRLRRVSPDAAIFVLDPPDATPAGAVPVIGSLEALARAAPGRVALLLDSGIGRLGLVAADLDRLAAEPRRLAGRTLSLVLTQLAGFTHPDDPENRRQLAAFRALAARLPPAPLSAATSSFAFAGDAWHLDLVRVGSALFGVRTAEVPGYEPVPVVRVEAPVVALRTLAAGEPLGYYRRRADHPTRVATIALGYADGLPAGFTERAVAHSCGQPAPFVAEATMTLATIDATGLPPGRPAPGDWVELIGPHQDANALGAALGLNPNRLLTAFGANLPRRYTPAGGSAR